MSHPLLRRRILFGLLLILGTALAGAACEQRSANPLTASPITSASSVEQAIVPGSNESLAVTAAAAADDCTATLSPTSKTVKGVTGATVVLKVRFPRAANASGCRWLFDSEDLLPVIVYGNRNVVGYKSQGPADITLDISKSAKRSNTQKLTRVSTVFRLKGPQNTVKFTLTAERWCPERNWC